MNNLIKRNNGCLKCRKPFVTNIGAFLCPKCNAANERICNRAVPVGTRRSSGRRVMRKAKSA